MKISVLIPSYNYAKYLPSALDSILNQTCQDFEIVIVDDGSRDDTEKVIQPYLKDKRIRYFYQKNGGPAKALNNALQYAGGEYVAFMDADDWWYPEKLTEQKRVLDGQPNISLCYSNMAYMDYTGKLYGPLLENHSENNDPRELLLNCYIKSPSCVMVRKSVLDKAGAFKLGVVNHDHDMWLRFIEVSKIYYIEKCLSGYRYHQTQVSMKPKMWLDGFPVLRDAGRRYPYGIATKIKRSLILSVRLSQVLYRNFLLTLNIKIVLYLIFCSALFLAYLKWAFWILAKT